MERASEMASLASSGLCTCRAKVTPVVTSRSRLGAGGDGGARARRRSVGATRCHQRGFSRGGRTGGNNLTSSMLSMSITRGPSSTHDGVTCMDSSLYSTRSKANVCLIPSSAVALGLSEKPAYTLQLSHESQPLHRDELDELAVLEDRDDGSILLDCMLGAGLG